MANVKTGWLEDNTGEKFAPKTYPSQVIMRDGKTLEDSDIAYIDETDSDFIDDIEKDASDTILVPVEASGFTLNEATGRYEQTITVAGMTSVSGGIWDIVRSGSVLTEEEAEIVANITDVERLENGVKISCIEAPAQTYTLVLYGTFVNSGETLVSSMPAWFNRVEAVENKVGNADISGIGDGTVTGAVSELNSKKPIAIREYKQHTCASTDYEPVFSITIPANSFFCFTAYAEWGNSRPSGVAIGPNGTNIATCNVKVDNTSTPVLNGAVVSFSGFAENDRELWVWGRWNNAQTSNRASVEGFYIPA